MTVIDLDLAPPKPITDALKPPTDRVTREPAEHPDRIPQESRTRHPVTRTTMPRRERIGAG